MSVSNPTPSVVSPTETRALPSLSRTNLMLLAILLVQLAVTAYFYWPRQGVVTSGEPLLGGITTENVTALTITDNNDRAVRFVKEGGTWALTDTDGYPARTEKIIESLDKLVAIATDRLVTQTASSHERLQVADDNYVRKVEITTAEGTQTLYLGTSTGASSTHVRAASSDATYLTSDVATWELDTLATTWIEVNYYQAPKAQIQEVTLENANGTFTFVRAASDETTDETGEADSSWTLADATADEPIASTNINTLIDRVATLNLHTVLGKEERPEYGLDAPLATITVVTSETTTDTADATTTTTLVVGAKDEQTNTYYLKSSASDFYVRLAAFTGDEFVNKQRSDFMVQAADATNEGAETQNDITEVPAPEVEPSAVTTTTEEIEAEAITTTTVEAPATVTDTAELAASDATTPTVDATSIVTDTTDAPVGDGDIGGEETEENTEDAASDE